MTIYLGLVQGAKDLAAIAQAKVKKLNLLTSYHYFRDANLDDLVQEHLAGIDVDIFADSGAFSAWTQGKRIDLDDYAAWLRKWSHRFTCAATLDVIGDPGASYAQTTKLRSLIDRSLDVLPTFHFSGASSFDPLKRYIDEGYTYIALGGLVGAKNRALASAWIARCFQVKPDHVRFHGFGVTAWRTLNAFAWYSVDSSSWTSGFRYGTLPLFDARVGVWRKIQMSDPSSILGSIDLLREYGLRPEEVRNDRGSKHRAKICAASIRSWSLASSYLAARRSSVKSGQETRIYLGASCSGGSNSGIQTIGTAMKVQ